MSKILYNTRIKQLIQSKSMTLHPLKIPVTAIFVANNNTPTGHVWTIQFAGGERATITSTDNPNGFTTTYRIDEIFDFWTHERAEIEAMLVQYAKVGNWEQEK